MTQSSLVLKAWGGQAVAIRESIRGTNNWTLLLSGRDRELVLRLYRTADLGRIEEEHRLVLALQHARLPFEVPTPIPTTSGSTVTQLIWQDRPVLAALFPMLPGHPPDDGNLVHASACGQALGQLHAAMAGLPDSLHVRDACPSIDRIDELVPDPVAAAADWGRDRSGQRRIASVVENVMISDPRPDGDRPQVIHADLFAANLLVRNDKVSAVLDFECAGVGPAVMDVAVATLSLCLTPLTRVDRWNLSRCLAAGYASVRSLQPQAVEAVPMLLRRREVTSFVDRVGRYRGGQITATELQRRADKLVELDRWLTAHAPQLIDSLTVPPQ